MNGSNPEDMRTLLLLFIVVVVGSYKLLRL